MDEDRYYEELYAAYDHGLAEADERADHEDYLTEIERALDNLKEALESYEESRFQPLFTSIGSDSAEDWLTEIKQAEEALYAPRTDE